MKPSEIRMELLKQHQELREIIEEARTAAERCACGEPARGDLQRCLVRLTDGVRLHNAREEDLMRGIFPTLDAWGPARADVMLEEHMREHKELYTALVSAHSDGDAKVSSASAIFLVDQMLVHMSREEKAFLGEDVLSDEGALPDFFGG